MSVLWKLRIGGIGGQIIFHPNWEQIQSFLIAMDGSSFDEFELTLTGQGTLEVGGGDKQRYIVVYFPEDHPDHSSLTLTDPSLPGPDVELTVQQRAMYPAKYAVQMPLVMKVVEHFFRTGRVPRDVRWELDNTGIEAEL